MQTLNILIVGEGKYAQDLLRSKFLNKLYITSDKEIEGAISIKFNTFKELAQKCKTLQTDIVLVENEKWVLEGIANVMKQNFINCFAVTSDCTNLELSHKYARDLLTKYEIDVPPIIMLPVEFPILVKGDGVLKKAFSLQEIIDIRQEVYRKSPEIAKSVFLEKFLPNNKYNVVSLYDGKHLLTFPHKNINIELLKTYSEKLEKLFIGEKANFTGFINSDLIEYEGTLYNTGFHFGFIKPDIETDILYVCLSALYQKLHEMKSEYYG